MVQVTARLPDALGAELDAAAQQLNRCRADIIRQAIEYYLDDIEDLRCGWWWPSTCSATPQPPVKHLRVGHYRVRPSS